MFRAFLYFSLFLLIHSFASANAVDDYLRINHFEQGIAIKIDGVTYASCVFIDKCGDGRPTFGLALWTNNQNPITNLRIEPTTKKSIIDVLENLLVSKYTLPMTGVTGVVHDDTIKIILRRSLFSLTYEDALCSSKFKPQLTKLKKLIESIAVSNKINLHETSEK
jgi:hypothetical protein